MALYLISFPSDAMDEIPEREMPDVATSAHAACRRVEEVREIRFDPNWTRCSASPLADGDAPA